MGRRSRGTLAALAAVSFYCLPSPPLLAQQAKHALGIDEFVMLKVIAEPQISPDGQLVAYTIGTPSLTDDRVVTKIWLAQVSSGDTWQATSGGGSDRAPRWSPDGKTLAFISTRDGAPQIWQLPIRGGEPLRVTSFPSGILDFQWSPDGKSLFFMSDLKWPDTSEVDRRTEKYPVNARIWTSLFYRHWNDWRAGRRQHLFRLLLKDGQITDITPADRDVPSLALIGRGLAVSPVGTEIAVVLNPDSSIATSTNNDIFVMGPDGTGRQPITTSPANDHSPAYSPDSRYIAYLATAIPGYGDDRQQVMLYERATGRRIPLTATWDQSVTAMAWLPDAKGLLAVVEEQGEQNFYRIDVPTGKRIRVIGDGWNSSLQVAAKGDLIAFLHESANHPAEVYVAAGDGRQARPLTKLHDEAVKALDIGTLDPYKFAGALGDSVSGWLMKPPGFDESKKYPMVYLIHGGPHSAWRDEWHPRWNYAVFAARGYLVAAINFHGSTGYGQSFSNSIVRHWGDYPYEDLMKGLDFLLTLPFVDKNRLAAAGASYGGYMVYWLAGHTDRFKTLVAHDGIFNPLSFAGTTDELWGPIYEFGGSQLSPTARAVMEKWSPANYVANWTTPMLIVHSESDFRVDLSEGLQAFTALRLRGVRGKFLEFSDEDHWVLQPRARRLWWDTVLDWLDEYLGGAPPAASPASRKP